MRPVWNPSAWWSGRTVDHQRASRQIVLHCEQITRELSLRNYCSLWPLTRTESVLPPRWRDPVQAGSNTKFISCTMQRYFHKTKTITTNITSKRHTKTPKCYCKGLAYMSNSTIIQNKCGWSELNWTNLCRRRQLDPDARKVFSSSSDSATGSGVTVRSLEMCKYARVDRVRVWQSW